MAEKKERFQFEGVAYEVHGREEIGVWTDGVGTFSDKDKFCAYRFEPGRKYRVTIEDLGATD